MIWLKMLLYGTIFIAKHLILCKFGLQVAENVMPECLVSYSDPNKIVANN